MAIDSLVKVNNLVMVNTQAVVARTLLAEVIEHYKRLLVACTELVRIVVEHDSR